MAAYCYKCGGLLEETQIEGRKREYCPDCGWINYEHLKVSAGCMVEQGGKLLLVQRQYPPFKDAWHLPSGYVEVDELPNHAALRETQEETGLVVEVGRLVGVYFYNDDNRGNGIVLFYQAGVKEGTLRTSDETQAAGFFAPDELAKLMLAGMSAAQSIRDWLEIKKNG